jgi:hypothetical protein
MDLNKSPKPTKESIAQLDDWLRSITAYHPDTNGKPWTFYEKIDEYLGPWKEKGYPIAYGKKYCILFSNDKKLSQHPSGARWVRRTLVLLQDALSDFVLAVFKAGKLPSLTETQLRDAAFSSHKKAYTQGGLTMVVMLSPHLAFDIMKIPSAEFSPAASNFGWTVTQTLDTIGIVIDETVASFLATVNLPTHSQLLRHSVNKDSRTNQDSYRTITRLSYVRDKVRAGTCDHVEVLEKLEAGLATSLFVEPGQLQVAGAVIAEVRKRKDAVKLRYLREIGMDASLKDVFKAYDPAGCRW